MAEEHLTTVRSMFSYERNYGDMDPADADATALEDLIDYIGYPKFLEVSKLVQRERPERNNFENMATFLGVSGRPIRVWADILYGERR